MALNTEFQVTNNELESISYAYSWQFLLFISYLLILPGGLRTAHFIIVSFLRLSFFFFCFFWATVLFYLKDFLIKNKNQSRKTFLNKKYVFIRFILCVKCIVVNS